VPSVEREDVRGESYRQRRQILEELRLDAPQWRTPDAFEDGEALWTAVCEQDLDGVVAKRQNQPYLPGERGWVKVKNRAYWRYELERVGAFRARKRGHSMQWRKRFAKAVGGDASLARIARTLDARRRFEQGARLASCFTCGTFSERARRRRILGGTSAASLRFERRCSRGASHETAVSSPVGRRIAGKD